MSIEELLSKGGQFRLADVAETNALAALFEAVQTRKIRITRQDEVFLLTPGSLTAVQSMRKERTEAQRVLQERILAHLKLGPTQIGPLCQALAEGDQTPKEIRQEVLAACRTLREEGRVVSTNASGSNFHVKWSLPVDNSTSEVGQQVPQEAPQAPVEEPTLDQVVSSLLESDLTLDGVDLSE